jgi:vacuolar-type H+-ATPase catalytic subunit A/Vma1
MQTTGMMKCIVRYYELAHKAIEETAKRADRISFALLKQQTGVQLTKLKNMKFQDPKVDRKELVEVYARLIDEITTVFKNLMNK